MFDKKTMGIINTIGRIIFRIIIRTKSLIGRKGANMNDTELKNLFETVKTIAVIGLSNNTDKPAYRIAEYLQRAGYKIAPVNPAASEVLGEKCYGSLEEIPFKVDLVDVFRKSEFAPEIAKSCVKIGAGALWLQEGITSEEAESIAKEAGMVFVQDDCIFRQRVRLYGFR
jgi:uncharacterized protein